jgi:hypothetical protein
MIALVTVLIITAILLLKFREDSVLVIVKENYRILREYLISVDDPMFRMIHREIPIVAYRGSFLSGIGYNTNKGEEIGICIDGTPNQVFHLLLHELAHCTVDEFSHSIEYWRNYNKLQDIAVQIGIYESINDETPFCGKTISD